MGRATASRERGSLLMYGALGAGAVILLMGIALKYTYSALDSERVAHAKTQANLTLWRDSAEICSQSVKKGESEAERRSRIAQAALVEARRGIASSKAEIERLRASKPVSANCPAGDAVQQIRQGLAK